MIQKKDPARICANCVKGSVVAVNNDILCSINGIVTPDYSCGKHRFSPEIISYRNKSNKCIECKHFIINYEKDVNGNHEIGLCQLFSVREFNGSEKNACSKFVKKPLGEVKTKVNPIGKIADI
ncbi:MAG TPA: hypothetical protein GXX20_06345 [Clostridiaceae bacterium]|nr:hypothetical protein [Clostridiaceae bacterium]